MAAPMKSSGPETPAQRQSPLGPAPRIVPFGALLQSGGPELDFDIELPPRQLDAAEVPSADIGVSIRP
jgi:hypothetical protein